MEAGWFLLSSIFHPLSSSLLGLLSSFSDSCFILVLGLNQPELINSKMLLVSPQSRRDAESQSGKSFARRFSGPVSEFVVLGFTSDSGSTCKTTVLRPDTPPSGFPTPSAPGCSSPRSAPTSPALPSTSPPHTARSQPLPPPETPAGS